MSRPHAAPLCAPCDPRGGHAVTSGAADSEATPAARCRRGARPARRTGLLDDRRFAVEYAARHAARDEGPRGSSRTCSIRAWIAVADTSPSRGIGRGGIDPERTLRAVATRRASQLASLGPAVRKRRLLAYLARRGYRAAEVKDLVEELC